MAEFSSFNGYTVKDATARNIAKGRNQAVAYSDYATMIAVLNAMDKDNFKVGQNVYIGTVGVPDLWVYSVEPVQHTFGYVSDDATAELLKTNGTIQCGFYKLAMLEGQKVDLTTVNEQLSEHGDSIVEHGERIAIVETAIEEQNKKMLAYNEETDCFGIMHNGTWYDIMFAGLKKIYAYAKGNEYTALTGGWSNANNQWGIHDSVTRNGTVVKHANFMEIAVNSTSSRFAAFVGTANKINLLNYKQIVFTFIDPNNNYVITKTLDIETISIKEMYIVCGLDFSPNGQTNGLVWGVCPSIGNLQATANVHFNYDQTYVKYSKMYLESVELIPNA